MVGGVCKDQFGAKLVVLEHLRLQEKYDDDTSIALLLGSKYFWFWLIWKKDNLLADQK